MPGLHDELPDIGGDNALHSLCMAMKVIHKRLESFTKAGGQVYKTENRFGEEDEQVLRFERYFSFSS